MDARKTDAFSYLSAQEISMLNMATDMYVQATKKRLKNPDDFYVNIKFLHELKAAHEIIFALTEPHAQKRADARKAAERWVSFLAVLCPKAVREKALQEEALFKKFLEYSSECSYLCNSYVADTQIPRIQILGTVPDGKGDCVIVFSDLSILSFNLSIFDNQHPQEVAKLKAEYDFKLFELEDISLVRTRYAASLR